METPELNPSILCFHQRLRRTLYHPNTASLCLLVSKAVGVLGSTAGTQETEQQDCFHRDSSEKESEGTGATPPLPPLKEGAAPYRFSSRQRSLKGRERKRQMVHNGRSIFLSRLHRCAAQKGKTHKGARENRSDEVPAQLVAGTPAYGLSYQTVLSGESILPFRDGAVK